ncbi:hypothetical protein IWW48_000417 [Coemansia sp. RSA 1200]|nr:hypothetical protein IWW48_000417 [Coemansia sp. RSA 1200]
MAEVVARPGKDGPSIINSSQFFKGSIHPVFSSSEFVGLFVLNGISIMCSLFVVVFIHMYRNKLSKVAALRPKQLSANQKLHRRRTTTLKPVGTQATMYLSLPVSLRLLFIASIIDVLYSTFRIYNLTVNMPGFQGDHRANCKASMAGITFFNLSSVFVRALLSVHLQLVILHNVRQALVYERQFLIAALLISLVLAILPLFTNNYVWIAYDPTMHSAHCGYFELHRTTDGLDTDLLQFVWTEDMARKAMRKGLIIMWSTNFAWLTLTVVYGMLVIVSVIIRLVRQHRAIQSIAMHQEMIFEVVNQHHEFLHMATKVTRRILQFPLMVVVCHVLEVVYGMATLLKALQLIRTDTVTTSNNPSITSNGTDNDYGMTRLYLASNVMLGMEGIITLFFLPLEPPIRYMLHKMYTRRKSKIRRLSTLSRATPRRRRTEYWPSARQGFSKRPVDEYSLDTASSTHISSSRSVATPSGDTDYMRWSESAPQIHRQSTRTNSRPEGTLMLSRASKKWAYGPAISKRIKEQNRPPSVTFARSAPLSRSNIQAPPKPASTTDNPLFQEAQFDNIGILRKAKTMLRGNTVRKPTAAKVQAQRSIPSVQHPIHRSKTMDEFPWNVVAVPLTRIHHSNDHAHKDIQPGLSAVSALQEDGGVSLDKHDVIARGVMELRRDGLPSQQWYIPNNYRAAASHSNDTAPQTDDDGLDCLETEKSVSLSSEITKSKSFEGPAPESRSTP